MFSRFPFRLSCVKAISQAAPKSALACGKGENDWNKSPQDPWDDCIFTCQLLQSDHLIPKKMEVTFSALKRSRLWVQTRSIWNTWCMNGWSFYGKCSRDSYSSYMDPMGMSWNPGGHTFFFGSAHVSFVRSIQAPHLGSMIYLPIDLPLKNQPFPWCM